jgi:hypothetical protein
MNMSVLRRPLRLFAGTAAGLLLVLALGAAASPSLPGAAVTSYPGALNGVSALSPSDAWAVGGSLILHWNGTAWARVPNPDNTSNLSAVSAQSPSDAWAVGYYCTSGCASGPAVFHALILRWNGSAWTTVPSPSPHGTVSAFLYGVSALSPSDAWAVGSYCTSAPCSTGNPDFHTLILHWNGSSWTRVASPNPGGTYGSSLNAVTALSPSDAWAVGGYNTKPSAPRVCPGCPGGKSLVLHWNGTAWAQLPSPSYGVPPGSGLSGVTALSPSDAWAVGSSYFYLPDESFTLVLRWNGTAWAHVHSPNPGPAGDIIASFSDVSARRPPTRGPSGTTKAAPRT